jgi:hypothetical protein
MAKYQVCFAQQTNAQDPQIIQQLHAIGKKSDEAFLTGDAAALVAPEMS